MQIRIVIRWSRRSTGYRFFTACTSLKRIRCLLVGHEDEMVIGDRALALAVRCKLCGWRSRGLTLDTAAPRHR